MLRAVIAHLIALLAPPRCLACRAAVAPGQGLCGGCRRAMPWLAASAGPVYSPVAYEGPARALVHALKFHGRTAAAKVMAAQIVANAPPGVLRGTLVPVPAHPGRRRERGVDHARILAGELGVRAGLPTLTALSRAGGGGRQATAGRRTRLTQDLGVGSRRPVQGPVVLVDDVVTTGATLQACARALGTGGVTAVTYARTTGQHALRFA